MYKSTLKPLFDFLAAFIGLLVLSPIFLLTTIGLAIANHGNPYFFQKRTGKNGQDFTIIKFKTMNDTTDTKGNLLPDAERLTGIGKFVRKTKLDELPQLWNVLIGKMSFVGPRPDVPGYADQLQGDDKIILSVRPGITGPASLAFRDEEELLAEQDDPQRYNDEVIWPEKVRINKEYIKNYNLIKDIQIIWKTVFG
jgi:lipopolysaccharide/colanic/teichoic acid biosynthesis glycosyltransferase